MAEKRSNFEEKKLNSKKKSTPKNEDGSKKTPNLRDEGRQG